MELRAGDADPPAASLLIDVLGVDVSIESSATPGLEATITTSSGAEVILT